MVLCGLIPTWSIVSYYSKNLILDALIFDSILVMSSPIILYLLGQGQKFSLLNWIGVTVCIFGIIMVKVEWN